MFGFIAERAAIEMRFASGLINEEEYLRQMLNLLANMRAAAFAMRAVCAIIPFIVLAGLALLALDVSR